MNKRQTWNCVICTLSYFNSPDWTITIYNYHVPIEKGDKKHYPAKRGGCWFDPYRFTSHYLIEIFGGIKIDTEKLKWLFNNPQPDYTIRQELPERGYDE